MRALESVRLDHLVARMPSQLSSVQHRGESLRLACGDREDQTDDLTGADGVDRRLIADLAVRHPHGHSQVRLGYAFREGLEQQGYQGLVS